MTRLANISKFPNATGTTNTLYGDAIDSHEIAFNNAVTAFYIKYGRNPDFNILYFRGAHSTTEVICEIWEEE